jgi:DNA invertase Pin-like site-specific DNA recombinase
VNTISDLHSLGVEFLSLKDPGLDFTTATGRLLFHIVASFSAFELDLIKSRTIAGIENAKKKGVRFGRPPLSCLDRVLELHSQGLSTRAIAKKIGISKSAVHKLIQKTKTSNQNK